MKALLTAFGVDYAHWKALTITGLRLDLRTSTLPGAHARRTARGLRPILAQLAFYVLLGAFMAVAVSSVSDRFIAEWIVLSYVMLMVGTTMLLDHNAAITSPVHYAVLAFQPITSRTWFAARLTNVLIYTLAMTTAVGLLPTGVFFFRHGPGVGAAALVALYACATTTTLAIVAAYASILRRVGVHRLRTALSYLQIVVSFVIYGGTFLVFEDAARRLLATLTIERTPWLLLYPGTWFASYVELAAGRVGTIEVLAALISIVVLSLLSLGLGGRLSLEYAERLGALATATMPRVRSAARGPGRWFRRGEARAVAILIRAQFRNDLRFRMGVLGVLPLTILYLILGLRDRSEDGATGVRGDGLSMITLAVLLFPAILKLQLARSEAFRASWVFFTTPSDRTRVIRSSKNVLVAFFVVPYLAFVGAILVWFVDSVWYITLYLLFAGLISHLALQLVTFLDPELPFSKPIEKGGSTARMFFLMMVFGIAGSLLPWALRLIHESALAVVIALALVIAASLVADRMTRVRVERQAAELEFLG